MHVVRFVVVVVVALGCLRPVPAWAQKAPAEIAVGMGGLSTVPYEDIFSSDLSNPALDARLTLPVSPRFSFEAGASIGRSSSEYFSRYHGLYFLQVKQRLQSATRGRFHAFLTYGAAGYVSHRSQREVRTQLPGGEVLVTPAYRFTEWEGPAIGAFGGGVQYVVAGRAALRADVQMLTFLVIPLGARFSGTVVIPLGRY